MQDHADKAATTLIKAAETVAEADVDRAVELLREALEIYEDAEREQFCHNVFKIGKVGAVLKRGGKLEKGWGWGMSGCRVRLIDAALNRRHTHPRCQSPTPTLSTTTPTHTNSRHSAHTLIHHSRAHSHPPLPRTQTHTNRHTHFISAFCCAPDDLRKQRRFWVTRSGSAPSWARTIW